MDGAPVEIRIPADPAYIRIVRLATSGMAATAGFDVEAIEDLKIAVDEMCTTLMEMGAGGALCVRLSSKGPRALSMEVETALEDASQRDDLRFELSHQILGVIGDEHDLRVADGVGRYTFAIDRSGAPAPAEVADVDGARG